MFDYIFSTCCPVCSSYQSDLNICYNCFSKFKFLVQNSCLKCQQPLRFTAEDIAICDKCFKDEVEFYDEMICVFEYNEFLKNLILRFKNQEEFYLKKLFAKFIFNKIEHLLNEKSLIIPVPLHENRLLYRGFNQMEFIANELLKLNSSVKVKRCLKKIHDTDSQGKKTIKERQLNVANVFKVDLKFQNSIEGQNVFIIDDVITTGATIFECAKEVFKYKPAKIYLISIGRRVI